MQRMMGEIRLEIQMWVDFKADEMIFFIKWKCEG